MPAPAAIAFAARYARALGDAGWRVALHIVPYALLCGPIVEATIRLRALLLWKVPLIAAAAACLHLATLLGAHVATVRRLSRRGEDLPTVRQSFAAAWRATLEVVLALAVAFLAGLAVIGAIDIVTILAEAGGARWPVFAVRLVAITTGLAAMVVLLTGATTLAVASADGRRADFAAAAARLNRRSTEAALVISTAIVLGTAAAVGGVVLVLSLGASPPALAAALGKGFGILAAATAIGVGAATLAADDERVVTQR